MNVRLLLAALAAFVFALTAADAQSLLGGGKTDEAAAMAQATLVIFNELDPDSRELAYFYAGKRGIPKEQVLGLKCAITEQISREEYDTQIAEPIRRAFTTNFWWTQREPDSPLGPVATNKIRF